MIYDDPLEFNLEIDLEKSVETGDGRWLISGYASTEAWDDHAEQLIQKGIDYSYFVNNGFFNDDHSLRVVGYPISEMCYVDGNGFHVGGELLKGVQRSRDIWELVLALKKSQSKRSLYYSVQGKVLQRNPKNPRQIMKSRVYEVAITPHPVNPSAKLEAVVKSMAGTELDTALLSNVTDTLKYFLDRPEECVSFLSEQGQLNREQAYLYLTLTDPRVKRVIENYQYGGAI